MESGASVSLWFGPCMLKKYLMAIKTLSQSLCDSATDPPPCGTLCSSQYFLPVPSTQTQGISVASKRGSSDTKGSPVLGHILPETRVPEN